MDLHATRRPATLRDVARRVGVTEATASAVLNVTRSGTRVSDKTRAALQEAAREMGYRPNGVARSLARRRTHLIGFYSRFEFLTAGNMFLSELVGGIQEAAMEGGFDLVLHTRPPGAPLADTVAALADRRVDGILAFAPGDPDVLPELLRTGLPVVALVDAVPKVPTVCVDDYGGGRLIAEALVARGHRRLLYRDWWLDVPSVRDRREGFSAVAREAGAEVVFGQPLRNTPFQPFTRREIEALTDPARPVTGIGCWEDVCAHDACEQLAALGLRVPDDVSVVGFNGIRPDFPTRWSLASVRADWRLVGASGVRRLLQSVDGEPGAVSERLPVGFLPGATLGPASSLRTAPSPGAAPFSEEGNP